MKNTVEENLRVWDRDYTWLEAGDEWKGQAFRCGCSYEDWKNSVVTTLLMPSLSSNSVVMEIGPGHGRWTSEYLPYCGRAVLVDLSPGCIEVCKHRFSRFDNVDFEIGDGKSLQSIADGSIDLVWSFDVFVHIDAKEFQNYLFEIKRVLKPGGRAILHHAGRRHWSLSLSFLNNDSATSRKLYQWLSMGGLQDDDGWRSNVSPKLVRKMAQNAGLHILRQLQKWGPQNRYGVPRYGDWVTFFEEQ